MNSRGDVLEGFLLWTAILTVLGAFYYVLSESKKPNFCLAKEDWSCEKQHTTTFTTFVIVNGISVPQKHIVVECLQWNKKAAQ